MSNESWWRDVMKTWLETKDIPLLRELERLKELVLPIPDDILTI